MLALALASAEDGKGNTVTSMGTQSEQGLVRGDRGGRFGFI